MTTLRQRMPVRDEMTDESGLISRTWRLFLRERTDIVNTSTIRVAQVNLATQTAAVSPPVAIAGDLSSGLYRVSVYAHRTKVAATSSSLGVNIGWRDGGIQRVIASAVDVSNQLEPFVSLMLLLRIDPNSTIAYEVVYASVNPAEMEYSLDITVEAVQV